MGGDKSHKKKKTNKKVQRKTHEKQKKAEGDGGKKVLSPEAARKQNPKAFIFSGSGKAKRNQARTAEKDQRRMHVPVVEREVDEPPPFVVLVQGPKGVGKTTLIKNLVKHYTKQSVGEVKGPITLVSGKTRRLTFIECPQDLHGMIDASKYADLVLLMVDGAFGFEMETFEFLNLLQVQGFPKVMGVLTHLDSFKDVEKLKKTKKALKHRFWAEIYQGAKLFYLNGMRNGKYMNREVLNLARFISVMKFRPLNWRMNHPFVLADRFEDVTSVDLIREDPKVDREVTLFGYSRGTNIKPGARVHMAGVGDFVVEEMDAMPDPCPLPSMLKKRGLNEKERLLYAPMSDVGGLLYDKDAVYIDVPAWKMNFDSSRAAQTEGESMVRQLQGVEGGRQVDRQLEEGTIQLFKGGDHLAGKGARYDVAWEAPEGASDDGSDGGSGDGSGYDAGATSGSEDDKAPASAEQVTRGGGIESQELLQVGGWIRRRAVFPAGNGGLPAPPDTDDEEGVKFGGGKGRDDEGDEDDSDSEGLGAASRWKSRMQQHTQLLFSNRNSSMQAEVYGQPEAKDDSESEGEGDLFRPRRTESAERPAAGGHALDAADASGLASEVDQLRVWEEPQAQESLRDRFVTGDWEAGRARDEAEAGAGLDSDDFGEFEDMETGEKFGGEADAATATAMQAIRDEAKARNADKAAKKAAFDSEYDVGGSTAVKDKPGKKTAAAEADAEDGEETFYDAMKKDMAGRAGRTKSALDALEPYQRVQMEGFRPGTYLRLRFKGLPYELVQNFSPSQPLLVGGLSSVEEGRGYMQLRLKRHRWFPKTLKTRDPLTFSVGWRRFQSVPVYAIEDQNGRQRMLKYTPEHMHCVANIYGAMAPTNTGIVAVQSAAANQQGWRISATGVVTALDAAPKVVKKLKLTGAPTKIMKNTAFISGMFNSPLEVAKFEGAAIRTVSGIRGTIKKASNPGRQEGNAGSYRATFEDKPLMSDVVFLRAWVAVDLPRFYNPVTNLLSARPQAPKPQQEEVAAGALDGVMEEGMEVGAHPQDGSFLPAHTFKGPKEGYHFTTGALGTGYYSVDRVALADKHLDEPAVGSDVAPGDGPEGDGWVGMKTVAQLRREAGVGAPRNADSLYRTIERAPRKFNPLKIPRALQADLPYRSKPKNMAPRKRPTLEQKRAVVLEKGERKAVTLVQQLNALRNAKDLKRKAQQTRKREMFQKKVAEREAWQEKYNKEEKKKRYVAAGLAEKHKNKKQRTS